MQDDVTNSRPRVEGHVEPGLREALVTASLQNVLSALPPALAHEECRPSPRPKLQIVYPDTSLHSLRARSRARPMERKRRKRSGWLGSYWLCSADLVPGFAVSPEMPIEPGHVLEAVLRRQPDGTALEIERPLTPLLDTTVFTNAPGEPSVGHELRAEIASADVDRRRHGVHPVERRPPTVRRTAPSRARGKALSAC